MDEFRARDRCVHLRGRVRAIGGLNQIICNGIVHIGAVPVRIAVRQRHFSAHIHLMQRCCQLDCLRNRHVFVRTELRAGHAVDQVVFPCALYGIIVPCRCGNILEGESRVFGGNHDTGMYREDRTIIVQLRNHLCYAAELRFADRAVNDLVVASGCRCRCGNFVFAHRRSGGVTKCVLVFRTFFAAKSADINGVALLGAGRLLSFFQSVVMLMIRVRFSANGADAIDVVVHGNKVGCRDFAVVLESAVAIAVNGQILKRDIEDRFSAPLDVVPAVYSECFQICVVAERRRTDCLHAGSENNSFDSGVSLERALADCDHAVGNCDLSDRSACVERCFSNGFQCIGQDYISKVFAALKCAFFDVFKATAQRNIFDLRVGERCCSNTGNTVCKHNTLKFVVPIERIRSNCLNAFGENIRSPLFCVRILEQGLAALIEEHTIF